MIKVLHVLPALDGGGAEKIVYDYVVNMLDLFSFDFLVCSEKEGILEAELKRNGCNIYRIPPLRKNLFKSLKSLKKVLKNNYDIIHCAAGYRDVLTLFYAKKYGIKTRIAHSHMAFIPENLVTKIIRMIATFFTKKYSNSLFACSNDAAKWMWGEKDFSNGKVYIMKNCILCKNFLYDGIIRDKIRNELAINENEFVVGCVARFSYQKNHEFLLHIFKSILNYHTSSRLLLVGNGELIEDTKKLSNELGVANKVIFTGVKNNVSDYYNAFDVFVLPSRFEGLGMVYLEAQCNGLTCFAPSNTVPNEVNVCGLVNFINPLASEKDWASSILNVHHGRNFDKRIYSYDLSKNIINLKNKYLELAEKHDMR